MTRTTVATKHALAALDLLLGLLLTLAAASGAQAQPYQCTFQTGEVTATEFPCEPAMVEKFAKLLIDSYPEVRKINTSPDYLMGLYVFAMAGCTGHFAKMTPEEIGVGGEPFFPREMLAAMIRSGRAVMCPAAPDLPRL
ncbi:hypothetical protein [Roseateles sp.]|uniref:hypothetical protein n=1 Tax=Roseateles sp. TaxID=1971397 RepID=UPI003263C134